MMQPFSASDLLRLWEAGSDQHPADRALTLIAAAYPDLTREELSALTVGERDARLLAVRERMFGPELDFFARCPHCEESVEFTLPVERLREARPPEPEPGRGSSVPSPGAGAGFVTTAGLETTADAVEADDFVLDGLSVRFRQPNADDLRAVATCTDLESARALLIDRCVLEASEDGSPLATGELPAAVIEELSERVSRIDPRAEILLDLRCPACEGGWELHFDIVSFVWSELCTRVERLFLEVDALAYAYGWSERDILAMSDVRRRRYLEEVG